MVRARAQFRTFCVVATSVACAILACGELNTIAPIRSTKICRPAPGPTPAQCGLTGADADWLPPAYARNASCRCQRTPNSPTANCVRGQLESIVHEVPQATRDEWRRQKTQLYDTGRHEAYESWLRATAGREIYRWHQRAKAQCCCAAALRDYDEWLANVTTPLATCNRASARESFGSCRGQPDRW